MGPQIFPIWFEEHWDTQPDQFYFEVPNLSGTFVLDSLGKGWLIPYQNIKVEYENQVFRIYDKQGTCYVFSSWDVTNESYPQNPPEIIPSYVSPWYLDKIEYLNGDKVEFYYERDLQGAHTVHYQYLQECYAIYNNQTKQYEPPLQAGKFYDLTHSSIVSNPHYLSKIIYKDQQIEFVYERESSDIPFGKRLTDIIVNHIQGSQTTKIRQFRFSYGRFANNRLKLTSLKEIESPLSERLICDFEYYEDVVPPTRNSDGIDHWGYFRANIPHPGSTQTFPTTKILCDIDSDFPTYGMWWGIASRTPDLQYTRVQSLKRILYPNGGSTEFIYELHRGFDKQENREMDAGGLRIQQIIKRSSSNDVPMIHRYEYEGGVVYDDQKNYISSQQKVVRKQTNSRQLKFYVSSTNLSPSIDFFGASVVYAAITEYLPNKSYIRYDYVPYDQYPDAAPVFYSRYYGTCPNLAQNVVNSITPKTSRSYGRNILKSMTSYDASGNVIDSMSCRYLSFTGNYNFTGHTVQGSCYDDGDPYNKSYRIGQFSILANVMQLTDKYIYKGLYNSASQATYKYDPITGVLRSTTQKDSDGITTETTYTYAQDFEAADTTTLLGRLQRRNVLIPLEEITTRNGKVIAAKGRSFRLNEANRKAIVPDCEKSLIKAEPIDRTSFTSVQCTPTKITFNSHYKNDINYLEYNASGQLLCYQDENGINHSFLYTSNTTRPYMTLHNARLSANLADNEVFFTDFEHLTGPNYLQARSGTKVLSTTPFSAYTINQKLKAGEYTAVFWHDKNGPSQPMKRLTAPVTVASSSTFPSVVFGISGYIDDLCIIPRNATLSTCHYVPGWGNTLETDEQGRDLKTEYNGFGLPVKITNHNGIVVKQYDYK